MQRKKKLITPEQELELVKDLADNHTQIECAKKFGISQQYVYKLKVKHIDKYNLYKEEQIERVNRELKSRAIDKANEAVKNISSSKLQKSSALNLSTIAKNLQNVAIPDQNQVNVQINNNIDLEKDELIDSILNSTNIKADIVNK